MEQTVLLSIAPAELRSLIADTVRTELERWEPGQPPPPPPANTGTDTMTRAEVLRALRCTPPTLLKLEKDRKLMPCKRIGRKPLWLRRDVERFLGGAQ
jgi:hypothetical protein